MIENDIKVDLERITQLPTYPISLPSNHLEGVIYQRISDPKMFTGLARTRLVHARFQVIVQLVDDYEKALRISDKIRAQWESIEHSYLGNYPVQTVERGNFWQNMEEQTDNRKIYRVGRDFILTYAEDAE